ncbi:MAG: HAD family phosphatase [Clostridiales bacterium]|nr:HAD family phosphatase [Clostridiales bacterium]
MKFNYIISDLDGLLIDTERLILNIYTQCAKRFGLTLPEQIFLDTIGIDSIGTKRILSKHIRKNFEAFYQMKEDMFSEYIAKNSMPIKYTVIESLEKAKKSNIKIALATSTTKEKGMKKLGSTNLTQYFDAFVFGDQVENGKPAPDIFLHAANKLSAPPSECVVLEDSPAGIVAAKGAKMHTIMIPDLIQPNYELEMLSDFIASDMITAMNYILT